MSNLSATEAEILRLLRENGEMFGMQMVKASTMLGRGTVYVHLSQLADKGLVQSRPAPDTPLRRYSLTESGHALATRNAEAGS